MEELKNTYETYEKEKKDNLEQTPKKFDINAKMKEMNDKNTKKEIEKANPRRLTINYDMFKNSNKLKEEKPVNVPKKLDINKFLKEANEEKKEIIKKIPKKLSIDIINFNVKKEEEKPKIIPKKFDGNALVKKMTEEKKEKDSNKKANEEKIIPKKIKRALFNKYCIRNLDKIIKSIIKY